MSFARRFLSMAALAAFSVVACNGCHSNSQQQGANNPNSSTPSATQSAQNPQQPGSPQSGAANQGAAPAPQAPPPPAVVDLPAGTDLRVRLDQDLGSKISHAGDSFTATVADDVTSNGQLVIPRGARAEGTVIDAKPLGRFKGGAALAVRLERVSTRWGSYPVATSTISRAEKGKGKRTGVMAGGGAGLGALIGGLAGGGKGALIGALAGGGAGTAGSAFTGNKQIFLPAETLLTFHLDHSVHITEARQ
jgi:glucose/arabinose dehydrogenase